LNGVNVGYEQLGGGFYRNVTPGHYVIAADRLGIDHDEAATVNLAAGQEVYLKLEELGWPGELALCAFSSHGMQRDEGGEGGLDLAFGVGLQDRSARHTLSGVNGMWMWPTPSSAAALTMAGGESQAPPYNLLQGCRYFGRCL
jgi:hypothetical protein